MADAADSKSVEGNFMRVRVSPSAKVKVLNFAWFFMKPLYLVIYAYTQLTMVSASSNLNWLFLVALNY